jgi:hypothetical protein
MKLRLFRILPALFCALLGLVLPAIAGAAVSATDKNPKPEDPDFSPARVVFDCAGRDTLDLFPGFAAEIPDSNTASESNLDSYACRAWNEQGPENIYRLEIATSLKLFAALRAFDDVTALPEEDFDIFLLGDCDTDSCLVGENLEFSTTLDAGTYYLIVDGYGTSNPAIGHYTLVMECRELGLPVQICEPGGAQTVNPGTETTPLAGNLFGQPNLLQTYECSPIVERGGEIWYAVTLEAHHEFSAAVTLQATNLDAALWLFDGCGPEAVCLDFADDKLAGQAEEIGWANDTDGPVTVYLGFDCYRPPETSELGEVVIEFLGVSNVPTVRRSFGSVRSLYR